MTTYYGVWSGEEWWCLYQFGVHVLFHTTVIGIARAQAMVANAPPEIKWPDSWKTQAQDKCWEARAIGEDGLPVSETKSSALTDVLLDAEQRLLNLPGVEAAYVEVMLGIDKVTAGDLSSSELAEYTRGVKAVTRSIREALKTNRVDAVRVTNWVHNHVCEDGTFLPGWTRIEDLGQREGTLTEEQKEIRLEAASHICTICSDMATNWVAMRDREWYFCERHEAWGQYVLSDHLRRRPVYYEEAEP